MKRETLKNKLNKILLKYNKKYDIFVAEGSDHCYCCMEDKEIYINASTIKHPTNDGIFCVLHEIGHLETYDPSLVSDKYYIPDEDRDFDNDLYYCNPVEEYKATMWAINNAPKYGIRLTNKRKEEWKDYIAECCKKTHTRNTFKLIWRD